MLVARINSFILPCSNLASKRLMPISSGPRPSKGDRLPSKTKYFGYEISKNKEGGSIVNISSDLGLIGPDQRIYRTPGKPNAEQPVKPITYSVVKSGLIGLTRYLATYWASAGVRVNALAPGGVENGQDPDFVNRLNQLIPMGRMAAIDEYQAAVAFMVSDASSYMTGAVVSIDGGRTAW